MNGPTTKATLAARLQQLRLEHYGIHGAPELAEQLGLPTRTWLNYEQGVTVPATVVLTLIGLTDIEPRWLLGDDRSREAIPNRLESRT